MRVVGIRLPTTLDTWKRSGWLKPELVESTNLNQVTLILKMDKKVATQDQSNFAQKNERSFERSFNKKDFDKVLPIIELLEEKGGHWY